MRLFGCVSLLIWHSSHAFRLLHFDTTKQARQESSSPPTIMSALYLVPREAADDDDDDDEQRQLMADGQLRFRIIGDRYARLAPASPTR